MLIICVWFFLVIFMRGEKKIILQFYYKAGLDLLYESGLVKTCRPMFIAVTLRSLWKTCLLFLHQQWHFRYKVNTYLPNSAQKQGKTNNQKTNTTTRFGAQCTDFPSQ